MTVRDKDFKIFIPASEINERISELAEEINSDYKDRFPLFIAILNGAFIFAADLMREINVRSEISFIKYSSYNGTKTTGVINELVGLSEKIEGRDVIIIEDIVDTGNTLKHALAKLKEQNVASVEIISLLFKPDSFHHNYPIKYCGFKIPSAFVLGYGLDYDGEGRNLKDIYQLVD